MATFKVGQRVKKIRHRLPSEPDYDPRQVYIVPLGHEGTVLGYAADGDVRVTFDNFQLPSWADCVECRPGQLAPLTDPLADAFVASIKRLKPYEEPKVAPRKVHV